MISTLDLLHEAVARRKAKAEWKSAKAQSVLDHRKSTEERLRAMQKAGYVFLEPTRRTM